MHEQAAAAAQDLKELAGVWVCFRGCRRQSREPVLPQLVPAQVRARKNSEQADAIGARPVRDGGVAVTSVAVG